jgi:hypothetical protein
VALLGLLPGVLFVGNSTSVVCLVVASCSKVLLCTMLGVMPELSPARQLVIT